MSRINPEMFRFQIVSQCRKLLIQILMAIVQWLLVEEDLFDFQLRNLY